MKKIKDLKHGDYFTIQPKDTPHLHQVYIRGEYDRSTKTYSCVKYMDLNSEHFFNGNKEVYADGTI